MMKNGLIKLSAHRKATGKKKSSTARKLIAAGALAATAVGGAYLFHNKLYKKWLKNKAEATLRPSNGYKLHYADSEGKHVFSYGEKNPMWKYNKGIMNKYDKIIQKIKYKTNKNRDIMPG